MCNPRTRSGLWHRQLPLRVLRTKGRKPSEPILRAFKSIVANDAVLEANQAPPRRPELPNAEFMIGNPPSIARRCNLFMGVLGQTPDSIALGATLTPDRSAEPRNCKKLSDGWRRDVIASTAQAKFSLGIYKDHA